MAITKDFPSQIQEMVVAIESDGFISQNVAMMVMDPRFNNGT
jgi:hypothetical protein